MTLAEELGATFLFEQFSQDQLDWVVARGQEEYHDAGHFLYREGEPAASLWILLEGQIQLTKNLGGEDHVMVTTDQPGVYSGAIRAFVRAVRDDTYPNSGRLLRSSRLFRIPADVFRELLTTWFPIALHLLDGLFLGVRNMEAVVRQQDKLAALGSLSAGLAHELNNPASAARRAASGLADVLDGLPAALRSFAGTRAPVLDAVSALTVEAIQRVAPSRDLISAGDREDELRAWLDRRGVADGWRLAPTLADAGLDVAWADRAAEAIGPEALAHGLHWVVNVVSAAALLDTVRDATARISGLVDSVRAYTYMDQAGEQELDVHDGLESTLAVLNPRLAEVEVVRDYDRTLPRITANGGELNQVWTNLIGNAIDAMAGPARPALEAEDGRPALEAEDGRPALEAEDGRPALDTMRGRLTVRTRRLADRLLVEIADTGHGIPPAIAARVFDPFFSTKDVGQGSGLGLDVARRTVVDGHGGDIGFAAEPGGGTRFTVSLPLPD